VGNEHPLFAIGSRSLPSGAIRHFVLDTPFRALIDVYPSKKRFTIGAGCCFSFFPYRMPHGNLFLSHRLMAGMEGLKEHTSLKMKGQALV